MIYIQILQVVTLVVGIFVTPLYLKYISAEEYGFVVLFSQIVVYLGIFDFGIGSYLIQRLAAGSMQAGNESEQKKLIARSFGILLIILLIMSPVVFLLAFRLDTFFEFSFPLSKNIRLLLAVCFLSTLVSLFFKPLVSALVAKEHLFFNSLSSTVTVLVYAVGSLILLTIDLGLESFLYAQLASAATGVAMNYLFLKSQEAFQLKVEQPRRNDTSLILLPSLLIFVNGLAAQIIYNGDRIILAKFVGVSILAVFALNIRMIEIGQTFLIKLSDLYIPKIVKVTQTTAAQAIAYYQTFTQAISVLTILAIINLIILNQPFIALWIGKEYLLSDFNIILLYTCVMFSHVIFRVPSLFLYGMGLNKGYVATSLADATLNLLLSILLVHPFGIKGVVTATLIATLLTSVPINLYLLRRAFEGHLSWASVLTSIMKPLLLSSPLLVAAYYFRDAVSMAIHSWFDFFIFAAGLNAVLIAALFLLNYRGYSNLRMIAAEINHAFHR